ncbi:hypothetical protein JCM8547_008348 [Rhodosporidiobolus lusitaniae]
MYPRDVYSTPDPRGLTRPRKASAFPRRLNFLSSRTRIHPVVLLPVFLFGALFSPLVLPYLHLGPHDNSLRIPEPVYHPEDYDWKPNDVFAEPDAPPLVLSDDDAESVRRRGARKDERVLARDEHGEGGDEWEWWDPSSSSSDGTLSGAALTSSLYTVHSGILYFSTSPSSIPSLSPAPHFAPYKPPQDGRIPPRPRMNDEMLVAPPPAPQSWLAPGELFSHPPGRRLHAVDPSALLDLHAPLPPAPARRAAGAGAAAPAPRRDDLRGQSFPGRVNLNAGRGQRVERDKNGHVLGPNAAAMARAKREGTPFVPGKPQELLEEEQALAKKKKMEEERKKAAWAVGKVWAVAPQEKKAAKPVKEAEEEVEYGDEEEEEDEEGWEGGDDDEMLDVERAKAKAAAGEEADLDIDPDDDAALLAAIRQLTPSELKELSPAERELVAELEKAERVAQQAADRRARRGDWKARSPEKIAEVEAKRKAAKEAREKIPVHKPVFKGAQPAGRGLKKRSFEVEEPVSEPVETVSTSSASCSSAEPSSPSASPSTSFSVPESSPSPSLAKRSFDDSTSSDSASSSTDSDGKPRPVDRLHPIAHLISRAEEEWDDLLRRQSQTLEQAVEEYERRYGMKPPAGFDAWWRYAMENRVILVDEYDQIHSDLLPFFSLQPSELRRRATALQTDRTLPWYDHSFGISVKDGAVEVKHANGGSGQDAQRTEDLLDILGEFAEMLPDLEVRFAAGDEPAVVISGEAKEQHLKFAKEGKLLGLTPSYEVLEPTGFTAWDALCSPNSTARRLAQGLPVDRPASSTTNLRSFVSIEHAQSMDLCEHPEVRSLNGITSSWSGPRPHLLYPLFSFSKTSVHADILVPNLNDGFYQEVGRDPVWEAKKENKVLWRGDTTGAYHARGTGWRQTQRARLVALANPKPDSSSTILHLASRSSDDALRRTSGPSASLAQHYLDVAYTGKPHQCSNKDKTCALIAHAFRFDRSTRFKEPDEENQYKYVLDVDANYPSGNFKRLMGTRSCVLKSTIFPEWWAKRIMPWYHYVPIQSDYSDLLDVSAFFIGLPDGSNAHDHLAKRIGAQGKKWADEHFREADIAAYLFRLYLEYARLIKRDEDNLHSMDYAP